MALTREKYNALRNALCVFTRICASVLAPGSGERTRRPGIRRMSSGGGGNAYDIVILGGGMVGATLACTLASNELLQAKNILLLEADNKHKYESNSQYSNRVVALNKHSKLLLSSIGVWQHIESCRYTPIHKMQVWEAYSDAVIKFNGDHSSKELAYIVENDVLLNAVYMELLKKNSVTILNNVSVENINLLKKDEMYSHLHLKSGESFEAKLLIGADGQKSKVRQAMDVQYVNWEYDQMGIVATVKISEAIENRSAWQRFLPTGTVALLPLTDSLSSLVWCITTSEAKQLLRVTEEEFVDRLNEALWKEYPRSGLVDGGTSTLKKLLEYFDLDPDSSKLLHPSVAGVVGGSRAAFPLGFGHATHYVKPGVALIGDAAHKINPLAGQGLNLGLGDITVLVKNVAEAVNDGALVGDINYLRNYEKKRQRYNIPTMLFVDVLQRLYNTTATPVIFSRSLGLQLINAIPPVKELLIQHAADSKNVVR